MFTEDLIEMGDGSDGSAIYQRSNHPMIFLVFSSFLASISGYFSANRPIDPRIFPGEAVKLHKAGLV